ncbi:MAG: MgtC/SapB family protein [Bacteroidetes bacterium]|nr:MgtC/SapB family protein [Bacteroidota bacterium]MBS1935366.1 MgtC/SapB family protein [Bacteroidota bacterium]
MHLPEDIILKLLLSFIIGGAIGAEREYRSKSAGFRTLTLICVGATMFTVFSIVIGGNGNPDRIASNIITGIGFVGAGVIFKGDFGVNGITTAAMIWVTAALGMAIGAGYELVSAIACVLVLIMLYVYGKLEKWIDSVNQTRNYKIVCDYQNETLQKYDEYFKKFHLQSRRSREIKTGNTITGEWSVKGCEKDHQQFVDFILNDPTVKTFEF